MIVPMSKYDLVVFHRDKDAFLERLQELGLVDVTTSGWEPDEAEHALMMLINRHRAAVAQLRAMASGKDFVAGKPYKTGEEAWANYEEASANLTALDSRIEAVFKEVEELRVWGEFDPAAIRELAADGVVLRYFNTFSKEFAAIRAEWSEQYDIEPIAERGDMVYFVVIATPGQEIAIHAHELKAPTATAAQREAEAAHLLREKKQWEAQLARAAVSVGLIETQLRREEEQLQLSRVTRSARDEAEGTLVIMEGWATRETVAKVDAMLERHPGVYFEKSNPSPRDEVPVKLKNKKWSSPFELIGSFYSLPKYGSIDLTAFFGPFYMVFFGFCLGDAGYGLVLLLGAFVMRRMARRKHSRTLSQVSVLTLLCGATAVVVGFLMGGFFGIQLSELVIFEDFHERFLTPEMLFALALGLGVVQIFFGLGLRVANMTRLFGFRYSLGTLGWMMALGGLIYMALPSVSEMLPGIEIDYAVNMTVCYALLIAGGALMLFFHNPDRNPLVNFGSGLWNTYNEATGFLGDILSYIRLFALAMAGGTLALVFNQLAVGMSEGLPIVASQLLMVIILLFGHGINLFMSALGAFVHPMRLTFVEFYKNAGFEASQREFTPLQKQTTKNE
ncbi:MAG: V-type ATP synthase subunit I [Rikenellaceae bacterium]|nr:V-type ATP synthase subunit I [Rikenellaceae bacterium]MCL2693184.1 V-type ATP synthase subunit I [Rikenellaceae bacterium]